MSELAGNAEPGRRVPNFRRAVGCLTPSSVPARLPTLILDNDHRHWPVEVSRDRVEIVQELLLEIARCPVLAGILDDPAERPAHPCAAVALTQWGGLPAKDR